MIDAVSLSTQLEPRENASRTVRDLSVLRLSSANICRNSLEPHISIFLETLSQSEHSYL